MKMKKKIIYGLITLFGLFLLYQWLYLDFNYVKESTTLDLSDAQNRIKSRRDVLLVTKMRLEPPKSRRDDALVGYGILGMWWIWIGVTKRTSLRDFILCFGKGDWDKKKSVSICPIRPIRSPIVSQLGNAAPNFGGMFQDFQIMFQASIFGEH
jgi:hypothetical protein